MLTSVARTSASRLPSLSSLARSSTSTALQRRTYAKAADPAPGSSASSGTGQQQWQRKQPLATAQTLTLFSETPQGLLIALRSTLQSMTSLTSRLGPGPNSSASSSTKGQHDHVLLYALSKDLPSQYLSEAVSILRGPDPSSSTTASSDKKKNEKGDSSGMTAAQIAAAETQANKPSDSTDDAASRIARVGILSSPLPASLIPANAIEPGSPPIATPTLYSVALSLLPGVNAIPFRSTIPGRAEVAVGRWTDRKPSWQQGAERRADLLDDGNGALPGGSRDWRDIWGRENLEGKIPDGLESLNPNSAASFIFFSDTSPHGLLEGLATQFPASSVLGLTAPPTPFETGRDQTILISLPQGSPGGLEPHSSIHSDGAVGVALVASNNPSDADHLPIPSVKTDFEGLKPFGPRREISAAQGNIISSLDGANAAQQFLRDIQTREHPLDLSSSKVEKSGALKEAEQMSELQARQIASKVKKEEDFFIAVYAEPAASGAAPNPEPEPLMLAQILSGHPSRGTLSIDTQIELGPGAGQPQGTMKTYAQFYQIDPAFASRSSAQGDRVKAEVKLISPSSIEIPGPDPSVWLTPRFLFLSLPASNEDLPKVHEVKQGGKHQVMALPNLFVAASERGWIAGKGHKSPLTDKQISHQKEQGERVSPALGLQKDGSSIITCTVPLTKATLSLRAGAEAKSK